ncbi:MAG: 3-oxoacid CoA-transferase subunit B [Firmicutes bacterium]|nr:3-oxoacid CoA-transferase subunit B [Bacillota bacterium]
MGIEAKEIIARRVARELKDGYVVNLGIGLPSLVANYIPEGMSVMLQSENGILGMGAICEAGEEDENVINAGNQFVYVQKGACFFDSATSFAMIRGGHIHLTVLGALQVDEQGNIASHIIPGSMAPGMGGAMDLLAGAKKVIVAMLHTAKGKPKILKRCTLPLTAKGKVDMIVTEKAVISVTPEGLVLDEIMPGSSLEDILQHTEADLIIRDELVK